MAQLMTFFCFRFPEVLFGNPGHDLHLSSITLNILSPQLSFFMVLKCDLFVYRGNIFDEFDGYHAKQTTTLMFCSTSETYPTKSWKLPQYHYNYHDELETTTQDELGMNRLRVNARIFFLCRNIYSGYFYHFHLQMISNSI